MPACSTHPSLTDYRAAQRPAAGRFRGGDCSACPWRCFSPTCGAADDPRELRITVKDEFRSAPPDNVAAVLRSAAGEIWRHCPNTKFRGAGFFVYRDPRYPITHFDPDSEGRIVIGLATEDLYWAQYAFQFAHEFCHALLEHTDERQWKEPRQANHWLDESLCETASLFSLRAMSKSWLTSPPYANWKDFAPRLAAYAEDRLDSAAGQLPRGTTFAQWFAEQQPSLRERSVQRKKTCSSRPNCCRSSKPRPPAGKRCPR